MGLCRYQTAGMLLHKVRRAMVNAAREPLHGEVEIDDTWVGGHQAGLRGSRQLKGRKAAIVVVAVEKRGETSGRLGMAVIPNFKQTTMVQFVTAARHAGYDRLHGRPERLRGAAGRGRRARRRTQPPRATWRGGAPSVVPLADRAIGNLQQWLTGTYHGVSKGQLQVYLDEFVFRHNRRRQPMAAFQTLLGLGTGARRRPTARSAAAATYAARTNRNILGSAETTG